MRRLLLPLAAAAALLAACGSDDKKDAKAAYIARVDGICTQTNAELTETNRRIEELSRTASKVSEFTDDLVEGNGIARDELRQIQAIPAPDGSESEVRAVLTARDRQLDLIDQIIVAARANDSSKFNSLSGQTQEAKKRTQDLAKEFGFKVCGQDTPAEPER